MLNYTHEPTTTTIETDTGEFTSGRSFEEIKIQTGVVGVNATAYEATENLPGFEVHNVHVHTGGVPDADSIRVYVRLDGNVPGYVCVKTADHTNVYLPIEMAEAIAKGLADHKFAEDEKICSEVK